MKCGNYSGCAKKGSAHYIGTSVPDKIVRSELNGLLANIKENEQSFIETALQSPPKGRIIEVKRSEQHKLREKNAILKAAAQSRE